MNIIKICSKNNVIEICIVYKVRILKNEPLLTFHHFFKRYLSYNIYFKYNTLYFKYYTMYLNHTLKYYYCLNKIDTIYYLITKIIFLTT